MINNKKTLLLICAAAAALLYVAGVSASWLGPYDTHDQHSIWLRGQMERPPRASFRAPSNDNDVYYNILDHGAVPGSNGSVSTSLLNGKVIWQCMHMANLSATRIKTVLIPAGYNFSYMPHAAMNNLVGVTLQLDGTLEGYHGTAPEQWTVWPKNSGGRALNFFDIEGTNITICGRGAIDGWGYNWWNFVLFGGHDNRPNILSLSVEFLVIDGITLRNAPQYHAWIYAAGALLQNIRISVDIFQQYELQKRAGWLMRADLGIDLPTFPLNTDGLDVSGHTVVGRNNKILNFDDVFCVKPSTRVGSKFGCTQNVLFTNSTIILGLGATCGSVGPNHNDNCINNCSFTNLHSISPIKGIYLKPNPGNHGTGQISDVKYENMVIEGALWWAIWASTQQQQQPGWKKPTCSFFYPLPGAKCQTQPRVPINGLVLNNIKSVDSLLSQGVMRCNTTVLGPGTGPCENWKWTNVHATSLLKWPNGDNFLCHALKSPVFVNVTPGCMYNNEKEEHQQQQDESSHHELLESLTDHRTKVSAAGERALRDLGNRLVKAGKINFVLQAMRAAQERFDNVKFE